MQHTVRAGDTLSEIAQRYGTTVRELAKANGISNPNRIAAGQKLSIPGDRLELSPEARPKASASASTADVDHPFLQKLLPAAQRIERKYGLPAAAILAQAALESNWGRSAIGTYNIFGIKGRGSRGSIRVPTREFVRGRMVRTTASFARFASYDEALERYAQVIMRGPYQRARQVKHDPIRYAQRLEGVYATDPQYAEKLIQIMKREELLEI